MPNLTSPIPPKLTGNTAQDLAALKEWGTALIDELTYLFQHLDESNVIEAASVKAQNIDTNIAKIQNGQIATLSADKLVAGTIDTEKVTISGNDGALELSDSRIIIRDDENPRFLAAYTPENGRFQFSLFNQDGQPTVSINSAGDAVFRGQLEGSSIFSSTLIGTDSTSYANYNGGIFAQLDPTGIKVMQDQNGQRKQKIGASVSNDGTAYLVLGAGNGEGSHNINGVVYTNGTFKIEKNDQYTNMGLVGFSPFISFWENSGELWLSGDRVLINGVDLVSRINALENRINHL